MHKGGDIKVFGAWNERRGGIVLVIHMSIVAILTATIAIVDLFDETVFLTYYVLRQWIFVFIVKSNLGLSKILIICVAMLTYFFVVYFLLWGLHFLGRIILRSKVGADFQCKLLKMQIGCWLHEHRLGYIVNLVFWGDMSELIFLIVVYLKGSFVCLENEMYNSDLHIVFITKMLLLYTPILLFFLEFISIIKPIRLHEKGHLISQKIALIFHESKLPHSTSSTPYYKYSNSEWYVLDDCEYKYLLKKNIKTDIKLVIVYAEELMQLEHLIKKYKESCNVPHITSYLYYIDNKDMDLERLNDIEKDFDFCKSIQSRIGGDSMSKIMGEIEGDLILPCVDISKILGILPREIKSYYYKLNVAPACFYKLYRNIFNVFTLRQAVNGFFDIIDLVLRLSVFVYSDVSEEKVISSLGNYYSMYKLIEKSECIDFSSPLNFNFLEQEIREFLCSKIGIYDMDKMDFRLLLKTIGELRNIKAHTFIKESELQLMFRTMFIASLYTFCMLDVCSMKIYFDLECGQVILKFKETTIFLASKYMFFDLENNLFVSTNRRGKYINMVTGDIREIAVPCSTKE